MAVEIETGSIANRSCKYCLQSPKVSSNICVSKNNLSRNTKRIYVLCQLHFQCPLFYFDTFNNFWPTQSLFQCKEQRMPCYSILKSEKCSGNPLLLQPLGLCLEVHDGLQARALQYSGYYIVLGKKPKSTHAR